MSDSTGFFDETFEAQELPDPLPESPFPLLLEWFDEARQKSRTRNPNAMSLSTVDADGRPSARMVLCKQIQPDAGILTFYTNYRSRKARALEGDPRCALLMYWDEFGRQIRVEGRVTKSPPEESDLYFASRAWQSRLGAWASEQSEPIASREALLEKVAEKVMDLGLDLTKIVDDHGADLQIPRPPHWGGYRVWAEAVELWCEGAGRVHERARWEREVAGEGDARRAGPWRSTRLQP